MAPNGERELLPYACFGVALAGLVYLLLAGLIKLFGANRVMKFFPPIVTGPIIIAIGLCLSATAINSCSTNWIVAIVAILIIIVCNIWGKGMIKIIPILLGVVGAYVLCIILTATPASSLVDLNAALAGTEGYVPNMVHCIGGNANFQLFTQASIDNIKNAAWIGLFRFRGGVR